MSNIFAITELNDTTLCYNCGELVIDFAKKHGHDLISDQEDCNEIKHTDIDSLACDCCKCEIKQKDNYFMLTMEEDVLINIADQIGKDIAGCTNCEGDERSHLVHLYNSDPFDTSSRMDQPEGISVGEYLYDQGVPDELHDLMCNYIQCPCGHGRDSWDHDNMNGGTFEMYEDIYTKSDVATFWGYDYEEFCAFSEQYGETIEIEALREFKVYLSKYPMMAFRHEVGQAIYRTLEKHFEAKGYSILTQRVGILYRGRTRKRDTGVVLTKEQMWSPPPGLPQHGRYNCVGVPVLYVCDSLEAIPHEIHPTHEDVIDVGEFHLVSEELYLFDLGSFDPTFQGFFNEIDVETKVIKQAYLIPNYIGTCCSVIGYHGVKYEGVYNDIPAYTNYALFDVVPEREMTVRDVISYKPHFKFTLEEIPYFDNRSPGFFF